MTRAAVIALSHGGGPMPVLGDPAHKDITYSLKERVPAILRLGTSEAPRAIVVVTAHWWAKNPTISNGEKHGLLFDYFGAPSKAYALKYEPPGSPEIAMEIFAALKSEGFTPELDDTRGESRSSAISCYGWDHGVFIPLLLINPAATIPIVQLSVLSSQDSSEHFAMGMALAKLRDDNVAIIGSGSASFHNLRAMFSGILEDADFRRRQEKWAAAMTEALKKESPSQREKELSKWKSWPSVYEMHPKRAAEHLMPLFVCAGAGGSEKMGSYCDDFVGIKMWTYYWKD